MSIVKVKSSGTFKVLSVCALRFVERQRKAIKMLNSERNEQECDARDDDSNKEDDLINIKFTISRLKRIEKMKFNILEAHLKISI